MLRTLPAVRLSARCWWRPPSRRLLPGGGPACAVERCKVSSKTVDNPAYKQGST
ncbi:hypothetical protein Sros01_35740 [Streptomyces roseochromogenus]|nr:hypothetical protein Sros01_35740 [Streptomyces roseochromogenus]